MKSFTNKIFLKLEKKNNRVASCLSARINSLRFFFLCLIRKLVVIFFCYHSKSNKTEFPLKVCDDFKQILQYFLVQLQFLRVKFSNRKFWKEITLTNEFNKRVFQRLLSLSFFLFRCFGILTEILRHVSKMSSTLILK